MFLETSSPSSAGDTSYLISPRLVSALSVSWYYHMHGATMGTLSADAKRSAGAGWRRVWGPKKGQQQTRQADAWRYSGDVKLPSTAVRFRFVGVRGKSYTGDMGVDSVLFKYTTDANPAALVLRSNASSYGALQDEAWLASDVNASMLTPGMKLVVTCGNYQRDLSLRAVRRSAGVDVRTGANLTWLGLSVSLNASCRANTLGHTLSLRSVRSPLRTPGLVFDQQASCSELSCAGIKPPSNGGFGSCSANGTLAAGSSCAFSCARGYTAGSMKVSCALGRVKSSAACSATACATNGAGVPGSNTKCVGTTGAVCNYVCNKVNGVQYFSQGTHRCGTSGKFSGGKCVASKTSSIELVPGKLTVRVPQFGSATMKFNVTNGGSGNLLLSAVRSNATWARPPRAAYTAAYRHVTWHTFPEPASRPAVQNGKNGTVGLARSHARTRMCTRIC